MRLDHAHRLPRIGGLQHGRVLGQILDHSAQSVANQGMIVDEKNLHLAISPGDLVGEYFRPCRNASRVPVMGATTKPSSKNESISTRPTKHSYRRDYDDRPCVDPPL